MSGPVSGAQEEEQQRLRLPPAWASHISTRSQHRRLHSDGEAPGTSGGTGSSRHGTCTVLVQGRRGHPGSRHGSMDSKSLHTLLVSGWEIHGGSVDGPAGSGPALSPEQNLHTGARAAWNGSNLNLESDLPPVPGAADSSQRPEWPPLAERRSDELKRLEGCAVPGGQLCGQS